MIHRRRFLVASSVGFAGLAFGRPVRGAAGENPPTGRATAKSTILFFLSGGASHVDMWDMKPDAPLEYRGPFQPIATSAHDLIAYDNQQKPYHLLEDGEALTSLF